MSDDAAKAALDLLTETVHDDATLEGSIQLITEQYEKSMVSAQVLAEQNDPENDQLTIVDDKVLRHAKTNKAYRVVLAVQVTPIPDSAPGEVKH